MITHRKIYTIFSIALASIINIQSYAQSNIEFRILPESSITLSGKSNVSKFCCDLKNNFNGSVQLLSLIKSDELLKINGADIGIIIKNFDCANDRMNRDMQAALKAEQFPRMVLRIMEINYKGGVQEILENNCTTALAEITLGNVSKCILLNLNNIELNDDLLAFTGTQEIDMQEFEITPPQVLLGLIKVNALIVIEFNLIVELEL